MPLVTLHLDLAEDRNGDDFVAITLRLADATVLSLADPILNLAVDWGHACIHSQFRILNVTYHALSNRYDCTVDWIHDRPPQDPVALRITMYEHGWRAEDDEDDEPDKPDDEDDSENARPDYHSNN